MARKSNGAHEWSELFWWSVIAIVAMGPVLVLIPVTVGRSDLSVGILFSFVALALLSLLIVAISVRQLRRATCNRFARALVHQGLLDSTEVGSGCSGLFGVPTVLRRSVRKLQDDQQRLVVLLGGCLHDLKAPLAGIANIVDSTAWHGQTPSVPWGKTAEIVRSEIASMQVVVHQALDFVRSASGELTLRMEPTSVRRVVTQVANRVMWAVPRGVKVRVAEGDSEEVTDPVVLSRAIENVLLNAMQHAKNSVSVQVRRGLVIVSDDGPGFPGLIAETLLQEGAGSLRVNADGSARNHGIGLVAAQELLSTLGGRLALQRSDTTGTVVLLYHSRQRLE